MARHGRRGERRDRLRRQRGRRRLVFWLFENFEPAALVFPTAKHSAKTMRTEIRQSKAASNSGKIATICFRRCAWYRPECRPSPFASTTIIKPLATRTSQRKLSKALAIKQLGLEERGWDESGRPGVIRHETGPEIIVGLTQLAGLVTALVTLFQLTKKARPQTTFR